jgi:hypothetical protein
VEGGAQDPTERGCGFTSATVARHEVQPAKKNPPDARLWVGYKVNRQIHYSNSRCSHKMKNPPDARLWVGYKVFLELLVDGFYL